MKIEQTLKPMFENSPPEFYSFFTKYSLMEDYGFSAGLLSRIYHKIIPKYPLENTIEYFLISAENSIENIVSSINVSQLAGSSIEEELNLSIKTLGAKVIAFGLDSQVKAHFNTLNISVQPIQLIWEKINRLEDCNEAQIDELIESFEGVKSIIHLLRKNKNKIGTNLHLTVTTRRILEYINRIQELLELKLKIDSKSYWTKLLVKYRDYSKSEYSIRRYIARHVDLVALEIVEHNANKGEKYIAESKSEYWNFFKKSLLGGAIIAVFALIKIGIDQLQLSDLGNAFYYSINYAVCFVLVKQFGGIIATKQPAVTATALAKAIDKNDNLKIDSIQNITLLVKKVFRSQFISIVGNFLMAIIFAGIISIVFEKFGFDKYLQAVDSKYLIKNTTPSFSLIFYAAIAGVFLALSGLIAGYIDNKMVASKIAYRIQNSSRFFKSKNFAYFIEKKSGAFISNICLGFLLGTTFLLSHFLPFAVDIRHIAFSSANIGYAVVAESLTSQLIGFAIAGALLIGFVNFMVSFSITLFLALKSRSVSLRMLPTMLKTVLIDFLKNPLSYFFFDKK